VSYKVRIPANIKRDIASWNLPRDMLLEVYGQLLHRLAADPDNCLGDMVVPFTFRSFTFSLVDNQHFPPHHLFVFIVDQDQAKKELRIMGCRHSTEAPEGN